MRYDCNSRVAFEMMLRHVATALAESAGLKTSKVFKDSYSKFLQGMEGSWGKYLLYFNRWRRHDLQYSDFWQKHHFVIQTAK
jgi:hypothetical protein